MNYRLPIGSSKHGTDGGYFLMITGEDRAIWVKDVLDQVRAELAVLHAAAGQQATLELLGQLQIEVRS
jgi:meiotically up-regulated gene 157 (Mug157) protein